MAQIDWNEFVVVETIDLFDDEELPAANNLGRPEAQPLAAQAGPGTFLKKIFIKFFK